MRLLVRLTDPGSSSDSANRSGKELEEARWAGRGAVEGVRGKWFGFGGRFLVSRNWI